MRLINDNDCIQFFFFTTTATTATYTLSLHDALPICQLKPRVQEAMRKGKEDHWQFLISVMDDPRALLEVMDRSGVWRVGLVKDRKSTRLNSSHVKISYAVFCLKKKKHIRVHSISTRV